MKVLKATEEQKAQIEGFYLNECEIRFILDANNNWVVGTNILNDDNFESIKPQLLELEEIDFHPKN